MSAPVPRFTRGNRDRAVSNLAALAVLAGVVFGTAAGLISLADEPLAPCTDTSSSVCSGPPVDHTDDGAGKESARPCPTEDSDNCTWDASEQGNGRGHDVTNPPTELP